MCVQSERRFRRHLLSICLSRNRRALKLLAAQRSLADTNTTSRASQASLTSTLSLSAVTQSPPAARSASASAHAATANCSNKSRTANESHARIHNSGEGPIESRL